MSKPHIQIAIGERFGRLTVLRHEPGARCYCQCSCGAFVSASRCHLKDRRTSSCGCLQRELSSKRHLKHGHTRNGKTPEYRSWKSMWWRTRTKSGRTYRDYGSRGITVCDRWRDFENFLSDMGPRPAGKTIDRINNDGNYEPGNCRWATNRQQRENVRIPRNNKSGHVGVYLSKGKWWAQVRCQGKTLLCKAHARKEDAIRACEEVKKHVLLSLDGVG